MFCPNKDNLTNEHIFPAFMGGELVVSRGSCKRCNGEFGKYEGNMKKGTVALLNLLQIKNRDGDVPNVKVVAEIRDMDLKGLNAFRDGGGQINLSDVVIESKVPDGRTRRQGFFVTNESGEKFAQRARSRGHEVTELGVPKEIVIEASSRFTLPFAFSLESRKVAAKIALSAIAQVYGIPFVRSPQFDRMRQLRTIQGVNNLLPRIFSNEGFMGAHLRTAHQHSVMCHMSGGMHKGWVVVTLFGGISYIMEITSDYNERESKQFSIFYDAASKTLLNPIVLADERTLIGHILSPATKFEDRDALDRQWFPIIAAFCAEKGLEIERIGGSETAKPQN